MLSDSHRVSTNIGGHQAQQGLWAGDLMLWWEWETTPQPPALHGTVVAGQTNEQGEPSLKINGALHHLVVINEMLFAGQHLCSLLPEVKRLKNSMRYIYNQYIPLCEHLYKHLRNYVRTF